jgi:Pectate lyase superfamily protein/Major tropism determinant N-terminal domain
MAVVQISKIQVRRGLEQDLPNLASAEFGWSVDTRKLYIGNGTLTEGAPSEGRTEVLTQHTPILSILKNYTFAGNAGGYTAQTGSSLLSPTIRYLQDKIDEQASVKDFGAMGDGVTDDTVAINRAITQLYPATRMETHPEVRRTLYFPAGTYIVTGDVIKIPPWIRIVGDGIQSSVIKQTDGGQPCLFQSTDSQYQAVPTLGQNSAVLAQFISIENLTLQTTSDIDIVTLDSVSNVVFNKVEFKGSLSSPTTSGSNGAIKFKSFVGASTNVSFINCDFINVRFASLETSSAISKSVKFSNCYFSGLFSGIKAGDSATATGYSVSGCTFASVAEKAIDIRSGGTGFVSTGNYYSNVGNHFAVSPITVVISYTSDGNYTIGDVFDRSDADNANVSRVSFGGKKNISIQSNVGVVLNHTIIGSGGIVTLADNTPTATSSGVTLPSPCIINYSITRDSARRIGSIMFSNDGTGPNYSDNFTSSTADTGVSLYVNSSNVVTYTSTSTGSAATLKYNINYYN